MSLAWQVAMLSRVDPKKFPKRPDALFAKAGTVHRRRAVQSTETMVAMAKMITVAFGGEVVSKEKMN